MPRIESICTQPEHLDEKGEEWPHHCEKHVEESKMTFLGSWQQGTEKSRKHDAFDDHEIVVKNKDVPPKAFTLTSCIDRASRHKPRTVQQDRAQSTGEQHHA